MHSDLTSKRPFVSTQSQSITGDIKAPGDKSISHRSLILGSQTLGTVTIKGLLESDDIMATKSALQKLGVVIEQKDNGDWVVQGRGIGGLQEPTTPLDLSNSGTGVRLLIGLAASYPFTTFFTGDESLSKRPMRRVITPLESMGATFTTHSGKTLPLSVSGRDAMMPVEYEVPVASAQVKSAILLAALNTSGTTTVIEPHATRDHTERMMKSFGFPIEVDGNSIKLTGQQQVEKQDREVDVPSDPSSAAFPLVAALITKGSEITIRNVCINPQRTGLFDVLKQMGAKLELINQRTQAGEDVADITASYSELKGIEVAAEIAPSMIDEYPILAVAAACAKGKSVMRGLAELRVKESDRLSAIIEGLLACGVKAEAKGDDLIVHGKPGKVTGGGSVTTHFDHRIAMSFLVLGMVSQKPITVDDGTAIATSFPNFVDMMNNLGAAIRQERRSRRRISKEHPLVIAIDGPAASGKGTLARKLADHFDLPYLDTGSLYRAVGMRLVHNDLDPSDKQEAIKAAQSIEDHDFSNPQLRYEKVGNAASVVSAIPEVRDILLDYQRQFAAAPHGAILDGRDIGTVVCPNADIKLFMTANIDTRADRRWRQLQGQGIEVVYDSVERDLVERDERDQQRKQAPLKPAEDAIHLDTSKMNANDVFAYVLKLIEERMEHKAA